MSRQSPIYSAYQALLKNRRLLSNPAQLALVSTLGRVQEDLIKGKAPAISEANKVYRNGIYIYGGVGTGKSRIADLFASTLPKSVRCRRIHFYEFMADVHQRLHRARSEDTYTGDPLIGIGRSIRMQSPVLCFDEFQVSDIADAMILQRLFGSFWNAGGVMISTSNRHPADLYLDGLNRQLFIPFIKDVQQRCLVWKMEGDQDYRMLVDEHGLVPVFYTNQSLFYEALSEACQGNQLERVQLQIIMNRSIEVYATVPSRDTQSNKGAAPKGVVHGTFQSLCEVYLGASDYHAVCNHAHTIFISGIRHFQLHELDFVRRFINLIDIAYESRTRIICLSDVQLADVFSAIGIQPKAVSAEAMVVKSSGMTPERVMSVKGEGGSSSSMMSTFIGEVEWSATGLMKASLASGGAGETDVRFAVGRAISRLSEMQSAKYGASGS